MQSSMLGKLILQIFKRNSILNNRIIKIIQYVGVLQVTLTAQRIVPSPEIVK